jgi:F-type H+-transporting ATPase subunit c
MEGLSFAHLSAGIGSGIVALGAGFGIGKIASAAMESIGRQPEATADIRGTMIMPPRSSKAWPLRRSRLRLVGDQVSISAYVQVFYIVVRPLWPLSK